MKKQLLFFLFIFSATTYCQTINFFTGPKIEGFDEKSFQLIKLDSLNLYTLYTKGQDQFIGLFDRKELSFKKEIKIPFSFKEPYQFENLIIRKDTFLIFYSFLIRFL